MKKLLLLLLLFSQTACASSVEVRLFKEYNYIDEEFKPYVQEFIYASQGKINERKFESFTMGFRTFKSSVSTVDVCHPIAYEVDISKEWWENTLSQPKRIELVFHELGHCILNRGHTQKPIGDDWLDFFERLGFKIGMFEEKDTLPDKCPASFMHPYTLSEQCINKHFNYYINELFKKTRKNYVEGIEKKPIRQPSHKVVCTDAPQVINKTNSWVKRDEDTFTRAKNKCITSYHSCLKTFWKHTKSSYAALCE
jgi:hypothetical protein